jgi:membrane-associated protein
MEFLQSILDIVLHLDDHLVELVAKHGTWTYLILFAIVFCETGLVVTPFLPGDSLLFAAGTIVARPDSSLRLSLLMGVLVAAALCGDNVNYWTGRLLGPKVFSETRKSRWLKRKHLDRTHVFLEKYGGKAIILARFVPIVRTFMPFVAGVGAMTYAKFLAFSIGGALVWVVSLTLAGYFFGGLPWVKENFSVVVLAIIVISLLPAVIEWWRVRRQMKRAAPSVAIDEVKP